MSEHSPQRDELQRATDICLAVKSEIQLFSETHLQHRERALRAEADAIEVQVNALREALVETVSQTENAEQAVADCRRCIQYLSALTALIVPRVSHALRQRINPKSNDSVLYRSSASLPVFMQQPPAQLLSATTQSSNSTDERANMAMLDAILRPFSFLLPSSNMSGGKEATRDGAAAPQAGAAPAVFRSPSSTTVSSSVAPAAPTPIEPVSIPRLPIHIAASVVAPKAYQQQTQAQTQRPKLLEPSPPAMVFAMPPLPPLDPFSLFSHPDTALLTPFQVVSALSSPSTVPSVGPISDPASILSPTTSLLSAQMKAIMKTLPPELTLASAHAPASDSAFQSSRPAPPTPSAVAAASVAQSYAIAYNFSMPQMEPPTPYQMQSRWLRGSGFGLEPEEMHSRDFTSRRQMSLAPSIGMMLKRGKGHLDDEPTSPYTSLAATISLRPDSRGATETNENRNGNAQSRSSVFSGNQPPQTPAGRRQQTRRLTFSDTFESPSHRRDDPSTRLESVVFEHDDETADSPPLSSVSADAGAASARVAIPSMAVPKAGTRRQLNLPAQAEPPLALPGAAAPSAAVVAQAPDQTVRFGDMRLQISTDYFSEQAKISSKDTVPPASVSSVAATIAPKPSASAHPASQRAAGLNHPAPSDQAQLAAGAPSPSSLLSERFCVRRLRETLCAVGGAKFLPCLHPPLHPSLQILQRQHHHQHQQQYHQLRATHDRPSSMSSSVASLSANLSAKDEEDFLRELLHFYHDWRWALFLTVEQLTRASTLYFNEVFTLCWSRLLSARKNRQRTVMTIELMLGERERLSSQARDLRNLARLLVVQSAAAVDSVGASFDGETMMANATASADLAARAQTPLAASHAGMSEVFTPSSLLASSSAAAADADYHTAIAAFAKNATSCGDELVHAQQLLEALAQSRAQRDRCWSELCRASNVK